MNMIKLIRNLFKRTTRCRKCNRVLTSKKEIEMGISRYCLAKEEKHKAEQMATTKPTPQELLKSIQAQNEAMRQALIITSQRGDEY